jgi:molybdopterin converting factor subunit 1
MIKVRVLFFATLREQVGIKEKYLEIPGGLTVKGFKDFIMSDYPSLASAMDSAIVSINREFGFDDDIIPDGADVALFPPVSGGLEAERIADHPAIFAVTMDELDIDELVHLITTPATGATCIFTGTVRGITSRVDPHETKYIEYEAYTDMAEEKMRQVAEEIWARWSFVEGIAVVQRIGRLDVGTSTVVIACSAPHRDDGVFEAARYGIDRLKQIVPIWKKEISPNGETWIEGDYYPKAGE